VKSIKTVVLSVKHWWQGRCRPNWSTCTNTFSWSFIQFHIISDMLFK